jgi:MFS family permease
MSSEKLLPWAKPLLISSTLTQATIYVLRPMITYRALELDANAAQIGLIASVYALFPVVLALHFGKWVGRMGEAKFIIYGTLAMLVTSAALMFADSITLLAFSVHGRWAVHGGTARTA